MKFSNLIHNCFYRYKIEKYDFINDSWFFKYGSLNFFSAKILLKKINDTGIYRLIKCYEVIEKEN